MNERLVDLIRPFYNPIRPYLPKKIASLGGVPVRYQAITDRTEYIDYKPAMRSFIRWSVTPGDRVVDIATGRGVMASWAAWRGGTVIGYEGAANMVELARETTHLAAVSEDVTIHHAVVGDARELFGAAAGPDQVDPTDLPACDVMILDCEGSEIDIIPALAEPPETMIVECHPQYGATEDRVAGMLRDREYDIVDVKVCGAARILAER